MARDYWLEKRGVKDIDKFLSMRSQSQAKSCEICGKDTEGGARIVVDHSHKTGLTRGWLCSNCNSGLGYWKDDIQSLSNAIMYLMKYEEQHERNRGSE